MILRDTNIRRALRDKQRGFLLNPFRFGGSAPAEIDPYWDNTILLLLGEGTVGSADVVDSSQIPKTMTVPAGMVLSDTQVKVGASSIKHPGGAFLTAAGVDFNYAANSVFTFEAWMWLSAVGSGTNIDLFRIGDEAAGRAVLYYRSSGGTYFNKYGSSEVQISPNYPTVSAWHHIAFTRDSGGVIRYWLDGVYQGTVTNATAWGNNNGKMQIGLAPNSYIDCMRITNGIQRYTANFTPPVVFPTA